MYRSLGGIAPAAPGYATVTIAPKISKTLDPVSANASVATVRGVVSSSWTRHTAARCVDGLAPLVTMRVGVPVGMLGVVYVPLLGSSASQAVVTAREHRAGGSPRTVWGAGWGAGATQAGAELAWLRSPPQAQGQAEAKTEAVLLEIAASELELVAKVAC